MPVGHRERKKLATKGALSDAALDLVIERGLDHVTAEAIAERAQVSTRTFHNYFSSKEAAVLFVVEKGVRGVIESFALRDPEEPVLASFEAMFVELLESQSDFDRLIAMTQLMANHATLLSRHVAVHDATTDALLAEIGRRTGTDPAVDLYPRLVFECVNAVVRAATKLHLTADLGANAKRTLLVGAIRAGFAQLRHGLPQPVHVTASRQP